MAAVILAILTFIGWGIGDVFGAIASRRIGALRTSLLVTILMTLFVALLAPFMGDEQLTAVAAWQSAGLGILVSLSYLCFTSALRTGNPALVGTISGSFIALVIVLSLVFLKETINFGQVMFILVILSGVTTAALDWQLLKSKGIRLDRSVILALLTMLGWGGYFTFIKVPVREVGWFWPTLIGELAATVLFVAIYLVQRQSWRPKAWRLGLWPALAVVLTGGGANITYTIALQHGNASVVAPIAGSYLVLFVLIASRVFKEKLNSQQGIGIAITLAGIIGLSILSS